MVSSRCWWRSGGSEPAGDRIWSSIGRTHAHVAQVRIGEQPAERISQALQVLDFGITASPLALVGKSGTVAAMLEHGLPVIASRNDVSFAFQWDAVEAREPLLVPLADDLRRPAGERAATSPARHRRRRRAAVAR